MCILFISFVSEIMCVCVRVWVGECARTRVHQLDSAAKCVPALTKEDGGHKSVNSKEQHLLSKRNQNHYYYHIENMTLKIYNKRIHSLYSNIL